VEKTLHIEDQTITRYLLGELLPEEQKHIEERYFSDPDLLDQVLGVEDDLIDAYVRRELTAHERQRFETYFLAAPERRERMEIAQALIARIDQQAASPDQAVKRAAVSVREKLGWSVAFFGWLRSNRPAIQYALILLLFVGFIGGLWLVLESYRRAKQINQAHLENLQPNHPAQQQSGQQVTESGEPSADLQEKSKPTLPFGESKSATAEPARHPLTQPHPLLASIILTPGLTRDVANMPTLVVPRGVQRIRLQLNIESEGSHSSYHASLQRVGAGEIWSQSIKGDQLMKGGKPSTGKTTPSPIVLRLRPKLFKPGEYLLTLTGTTPTGETEVVGDYPFTIVKQR
jgi:anti-sigma factor RsiW